MKAFPKIILSLVVFGLGIGVGYAYKSPDKPEMLIGEITAQDLQRGIYQSWYKEHHDTYEGNAEIMAQLPALLEGVTIRLIMGTWCHVSQREVPRFMAIMEGTGFDRSHIRMIAVDKEFTVPDFDKASDFDKESLGITNTPTFIFYRGDKEINRIVETPVVSLEQDMLTILKGETYRHSKMQ